MDNNFYPVAGLFRVETIRGSGGAKEWEGRREVRYNNPRVLLWDLIYRPQRTIGRHFWKGRARRKVWELEQPGETAALMRCADITSSLTITT